MAELWPMKSNPCSISPQCLQGVSMMTFEMHVRTQLELSNIPEDFPMPKSETPLEVWEVTVQVRIFIPCFFPCVEF